MEAKVIPNIGSQFNPIKITNGPSVVPRVNISALERTEDKTNPLCNLRKKIGNGVEGTVYEVVTDTDTKELKALKQVEAQSQIIPVAEIVISRQIRHPNLLYCDRVITSKDCPGFSGVGLVLPLGLSNLRRYLETDRVSLSEKLNLAQNVVNGLYALHRNSFLHLDLKPENIIVFKPVESKEAIAVVSDFGLAQLALVNPEGLVASDAKRVGITLWYRPPENLVPGPNDRVFTIKSDIWSYGIILLYICSGYILGQSVFDGKDSDTVANKKQLEEINKYLNPNIIEGFLISKLQHFDTTKRIALVTLLKRILNFNPELRPNSIEILQSSVFNSQPIGPTTYLPTINKPVIEDNLPLILKMSELIINNIEPFDLRCLVIDVMYQTLPHVALDLIPTVPDDQVRDLPKDSKERTKLEAKLRLYLEALMRLTANFYGYIYPIGRTAESFNLAKDLLQYTEGMFYRPYLIEYLGTSRFREDVQQLIDKEILMRPDVYLTLNMPEWIQENLDFL